ncbi:MAG: ATP-binding protein [Anaerolineales bacterium]|jgi:signal transduction histidine kinase
MIEKDKPSGPDTAIRKYPTLLRRYANLLELIHRLSSTVHLEDIYTQVLEGTVSLLECRAAVLLLVDPTNGDIQIASSANIDLSASQHRSFPIHSSLAGKVVKESAPILISDSDSAQKDALLEFTLYDALKPESILAVPLQSKNATIGVLEAIDKLQGEFQPEDFSSLEALASQASAVIENIRLFRQSDLIAELVHEIRTPLAALATASALLDRQDLSETQRHSVLSTFRHEIQRLNELTDDYLDLARLESGRTRLQTEWFSAAALLSECAEIISPLIHAQGLRFRQEIVRDSLDIVADRAKIKQVILNLLNNAVKYNNPNGEIILRAYPAPVTTGKTQEIICIEVSDTGKGIPAESLPHLFERFYRPQEGSGLARGTGLGLHISKYIIESHHGHLEVKSTFGQGSTFVIRLPVNPPGRITGPLSGQKQS